MRKFNLENGSDELTPEEIASIEASLSEVDQDEVGFEDPVQLYELLEAIWDPNYPIVSYKLPYPTAEWYVGMTNQFMKDIQKIDRKLQGRILQAISHISSDPTSPRGNTVKPLSTELKGLWRCRIGDYRMIYLPNVQDKQITLISFSSRSDAYD